MVLVIVEEAQSVERDGEPERMSASFYTFVVKIGRVYRFGIMRV